jgi:hypothetical protein
MKRIAGCVFGVRAYDFTDSISKCDVISEVKYTFFLVPFVFCMIVLMYAVLKCIEWWKMGEYEDHDFHPRDYPFMFDDVVVEDFERRDAAGEFEEDYVPPPEEKKKVKKGKVKEEKEEEDEEVRVVPFPAFLLLRYCLDVLFSAEELKGFFHIRPFFKRICLLMLVCF